MNFFKAKKTICFKNKVFGDGTLIEGETYFSYSQFAEEAVSQGIAELVSISGPSFKILEHGPVDLFSYNEKRLLLYFPGGFGDAAIAGMVLPYVEERYGITIDICCSREKYFDIFIPMGIKGNWVAYPPDIKTLSLYKNIITDITSLFAVKGTKVSPIMQICSSFGIKPNELPDPVYKIDEESKAGFQIRETKAPRLGINFDSNGEVKSYPASLHIDLLSGIKQFGFDICIMGRKSPSHKPVSEELATDTRDSTNIRDLAFLISRMDIIVAVDSFICHMANIMNIPTNVLLSTTSSSFFSLHSNVNCISSGIQCAPCYSVFNDCPLGYSECRAFFHSSITPSIIAASTVRTLLNSMRKSLEGDNRTTYTKIIN